MGFLAALDGARRDFSLQQNLPPTNVFLALLLRGLVVFAILIGAALCLRRDGETHKRLMLMGSIAALLPTAAGRLVDGNQAIAIPITLAFLAASPLYDKLSRGAVHPVNRWLPWLVFATSPLSMMVGSAPWWDRIVTWLLR